MCSLLSIRCSVKDLWTLLVTAAAHVFHIAGGGLLVITLLTAVVDLMSEVMGMGGLQIKNMGMVLSTFHFFY